MLFFMISIGTIHSSHFLLSTAFPNIIIIIIAFFSVDLPKRYTTKLAKFSIFLEKISDEAKSFHEIKEKNLGQHFP